MKKRLLISVIGRVQGVSFRYYTREIAIQLGLTGWVRNEKNGNVCIIAEGEENTLNEFLNWCKNGPKSAEVIDLRADWDSYKGDLSQFEIKYKY